MPDYTPHTIDFSLYPSCDETTEFASDQELETSKRYRDAEGTLSLIEIFRMEDDKRYLFRRKILAAEEGKANLEMFDSSGALTQFAFGSYDENGNMNGKWVCHRAEGYKFFECAYTNDKANGPYTYYQLNGEKFAEGVFEDDLDNGIYTDYYPNGKIHETGLCEKGSREGTWTRYHENGAVHKQGEYRESNQEGLFRCYDRKGPLKELVIFKNNDEIFRFTPSQEAILRQQHDNTQDIVKPNREIYDLYLDALLQLKKYGASSEDLASVNRKLDL